ncbi:MAG: F-box/SEL1-like repeat protein [Chlamydiales bacterium]|nr:F-box/SEL1-like repeat protein [Chlamydiales bacterium]
MSVELLSAQIESLTLGVPERARSLIQAPELHMGRRVLAIRDLLHTNGQYQLETPLANKVLDLVEAVSTPAFRTAELQKFEISLKKAHREPPSVCSLVSAAFSALMPFFWGSGEIEGLKDYHVTEKDLKLFDRSKFWKMVQKEQFDRVVITRPSKPELVYSDRVLECLIAKAVDISALTQEFTIRFDSGEQTEPIPKAFLLLCGDYFTRNRGEVFSEFDSVITINGISLNGFCGILAMVNNGELDNDIILEEYVACKNLLSFCELSNSDPLAPPAYILTDEALRSIFAQLPNQTFLDCRRVCKKWYVASNHLSAWTNRIFPLTISSGNCPPFAQFFSPAHYTKDAALWQNFKGRIQDIMRAANGGNADAQFLVAARFLLKEGDYTISTSRALEWLAEGHPQNTPKIEYILGRNNELTGNQALAESTILHYKRSAELGYTRAQNRLGVLYEEGNIVPQDLEEAAKWYRKAAELGNIDAQVNLAALLLYSQPQESLKWALPAAKKGLARAQNLVGVLYYEVLDVRNEIEAHYWFERAAQQGEKIAERNLGHLYRDKKDYCSAFHWLFKAAIQQDAEAQNSVGLLFYYGQGIYKDLEDAAKWFLLAAEQGHNAAQFNIGIAFYNGHGVGEDHAEAFKWLLLAAKQGHIGAQCKVAIMYKQGDGVAADMAQAINWLESAANAGKLEACYQLGQLYEKGEFVPVDMAQAFVWHYYAAKRNHSGAQYAVATMYENGHGVAVDLRKAFKWDYFAAQDGHKEAQYRLAKRYELGQGIQKNIKQAIKWYRLSALDDLTYSKTELQNHIAKLELQL